MGEALITRRGGSGASMKTGHVSTVSSQILKDPIFDTIKNGMIVLDSDETSTPTDWMLCTYIYIQEGQPTEFCGFDVRQFYTIENDGAMAENQIGKGQLKMYFPVYFTASGPNGGTPLSYKYYIFD